MDSPCVLVTTSRRVATNVNDLVSKLIASLPQRARNAAEISWRDVGEIIHVQSREEMCSVSDEIASEHLEVHCADLEYYHEHLRNYGSLFLGEETCVTFGDKVSGPNHVLPTRKASRYSGGLNVMMFTKTVTWQRMSRSTCKIVAPFAARLSRAEGMEAHARAADVRMQKYFPNEKFDLSSSLSRI